MNPYKPSGEWLLGKRCNRVWWVGDCVKPATQVIIVIHGHDAANAAVDLLTKHGLLPKPKRKASK